MTPEQILLAMGTGFGCWLVLFLTGALYVAVMIASGKWIEEEEIEIVTEPVNRREKVSLAKQAGYRQAHTYEDPSRGGKMVVVMVRSRIRLFGGMR